MKRFQTNCPDLQIIARAVSGLNVSQHIVKDYR